MFETNSEMNLKKACTKGMVIGMKHTKIFSKRILSFILGLMLSLTAVSAVVSDSALVIYASNESLSDDIVVLYTNDVHSYIDGTLSYDVIAYIKKDLNTRYKYVFLADAGDHVQGTAYGAMDKGKTVVKMMNEAGYDVATLGNHEFDYGMQGCMDIIASAEYEYLSCNFYHEENDVRGENVLKGFKIFDCGNEKLAFIGITTPETFASSTPTYFQNENGEYIYGISGGEDGSDLYKDVSDTIAAAKAEGATKVIAVGHLGSDISSGVWTSEAVIGAVSGLDAFIDGHSHTVMEGKAVADKDGENVVLTQTGEYFNRIGMMVIDSETGDVSTDFIEYDSEKGELSSELYGEKTVSADETVKETKNAWMTEIDDRLGEVIGKANIVLDNYDSDGNRLVRLQETNTGDFSADALYYLFDSMGLDVDAAVMNGGGVRNKAVTGEITYKTCKDIHTFGNVACLQTVTGKQLLDALEWGARHMGEGEDGSLLHVAGVKYKVDTSIPNTAKADDMGIWIGAPEKYRVYDVEIYNKSENKWDELDLEGKYNLAGYNYTLRDLGDGFAMLDGSENVLDYVMEDYMVLANYIKAFENGVVDAENSPLLSKYPEMDINYGDVSGCGRITVKEAAEQAPDTSDESLVWLVISVMSMVCVCCLTRKSTITHRKMR